MQSSRFLDELELAARSLERADTGLTVNFTRGPSDREKPAAWVVLESDLAQAQLTVWTTGECERDIYWKSGTPPNVLPSTILGAPDVVAQALQELASACTAGSLPIKPTDS